MLLGFGMANVKIHRIPWSPENHTVSDGIKLQKISVSTTLGFLRMTPEERCCFWGIPLGFLGNGAVLSRCCFWGILLGFIGNGAVLSRCCFWRILLYIRHGIVHQKYFLYLTWGSSWNWFLSQISCQKSCNCHPTQQIAVPKFQRGFDSHAQAAQQWEHLRPRGEEAQVWWWIARANRCWTRSDLTPRMVAHCHEWSWWDDVQTH